MNKIKFIIHILVAVIFFGCTDEEIFKSKGDIEVVAGFANTRTTFVEDDGTTHVEWKENDAIGLFTERQSNLQYLALSAGKNTKFSAVREKLEANEGEMVYAYYPSTWGIEGEFNVQLPNLTFQEYQENASNYDFIYTSAEVTDNKVNLQFKHLFAFLKIKIPLDLIDDRDENGGITLISSENISGCEYFDLKNEKIIANQDIHTINYCIPSDEKLGNRQDVICYIAILPQSENAEIRILTNPGGEGIHTLDLLLSKHAPTGGFKAGNVYTLHINETENEIEREALVAFYKATNGDSWKNNTNWCSDKPISEWYGITAKGEVSEINLYDNNLSGVIPDEIGNLKYLKQLILYANNLSGEIPASLKNTRLETLHLWYNQFEGNIPETIGDLVNLVDLNLGSNRFSGSLPNSLTNLVNLRRLSLSDNALTGFGEKLSALKSLEAIEISMNQISGEIPADIWTLPNLKRVDLSTNKLSGPIPMDITKAVNLEVLNLGCNDIGGKFPTYIFELTKLKELHLQICNITDGFPADIVKLTNLEVLDLSGNSLTGEIPEVIGDLSNLRWLGCGNNLFTGAIPVAICELSNIEFLDFGNATGTFIGGINYIFPNNNNFTGEIPKHVNKLQNMSDFIICNNNIEGNLPEELAELPALTNLVVFGNRLQGKIPDRLVNSTLWNTWNPGERILPQQIGYMLYIGDNISTDFSKDKDVFILQTHTKGNGIKLVLMGDAFIDVDMESGGKYETMMKKAMESYFSIEPFSSLRDYYDVIGIKAVSKNDVVGKETTFETKYTGGVTGSEIRGNNDKCMEYASKALGTNILDNVQVVVVMNDTKWGGTCYWYTNGFSIAYSPYIYNSDEQFDENIHHEANGHGFGFLGDEYFYFDDTIPQDIVISLKEAYDNYGWYSNFDFTSELSQLKWSHFITDSRYEQENIGAWEGGDVYYSKGIYRPTEHSAMRGNLILQFNAPQRETIYKRAMRLAYGDSWTYDYEEFVEFDTQGRTKWMEARNKDNTRSVQSNSRSKRYKHIPPKIFNYPAVVK